MATVGDVTDIVQSGQIAIDALLDNGPCWNYLTPVTENVLYYTFDNMYTPSKSITNTVPFTASQIAAARQAITYAESVTGIDFVQTSDPTLANISFFSANIMEPGLSGLTEWRASYNYAAGGVITSYDVNTFIYLDIYDYPENLSPNAGTNGYQVLLHEIGHTLGLKHPFEGSPQLPESLNNTDNTLMAYNWTGQNKTTFMKYDLEALWWIYGGDGLGGIYGINSTAGPTLPQTVDIIPPDVVSYSPANGAADVAHTTDIVITFNEPIQIGSGNINIKNAAATAIETFNAANTNISVSGNTLTINPTADLSSDQEYTIEFSADSVRDQAGNSYASTACYHFSAIDTTPPGVVSFSPTNETPDVAHTIDIVITFNEPIQIGSGNINIKNAAATAIETFNAANTNISVSGNTLTINPTADLSSDQEYTIEFSADSIRDQTGNSYANTTSYHLSTLTHPTVVGTTDADVIANTLKDEIINGGAGLDTVVYEGMRSMYTLSKQANGSWVTSSSIYGTDTLTDIERLKFTDMNIALDLNGNAGLVAKATGVVFGSENVKSKEHIGFGLGLVDSGTSYEELLGTMLDKAGAKTPQQVVDLLWTNTVGIPPTVELTRACFDLLQSGMTEAQLGVLAAETDIYQANINLVGLFQTGLEYM